MKPEAEQQKRDAGFMLVDTCEKVLGVCGPTALAALTGRSKSWWSKLASGAAAFPTWEELEALLPPGMTVAERESLHRHYRRAWLLLYDPELREWFDTPHPPRVGLADMKALKHSAFILGYNRADHQEALRLLRILEMLLLSRGVESLSREELALLLDCLNHQSVCERELKQYDAAIAVARRSVGYQRAGGSRVGELLARHTVGLAQQQAGFLAQALKEFEELHREFQRLGLEPQVIGTRRDIGGTRLAMGRPEQGEAELLRSYEMPGQTGDSQFRTGLWLAEASLHRRNVEQARRWLAKARVIERRYPKEIAGLMSLRYIANHCTDLERRAAAPQRSRKR